jgi:hypothetical protein
MQRCYLPQNIYIGHFSKIHLAVSAYCADLNTDKFFKRTKIFTLHAYTLQRHLSTSKQEGLAQPGVFFKNALYISILWQITHYANPRNLYNHMSDKKTDLGGLF